MNTRNLQSIGALPVPVPAIGKINRDREHQSLNHPYISLDRNERLTSLPEWFLVSLRESLQSSLLTAYPVQDQLHQKLSEQLKLREEQVLLTSGSDAAIKSIYQAYSRPGDGVIIFEPTYAMNAIYAQMFQAVPIPISYDSKIRLDPNELLRNIVPGVRLIMIPNPNQPTATVLGEDVLMDVLDKSAGIGALVVIDEAYYPFSRTTCLPWIHKYPHLVIIRSFSKAAGLAGLRVGFVAGHKDVVGTLYKVRSAYDVNSVGIVCASLILDHPEIVDDYVIEVEAGARLLSEKVVALGFTPIPTHTNFMLIRVGRQYTPAQVVNSLRVRGYLVKGPFRSPFLDDCIRVTLGPPDIMAPFVECLQEVLELR